jgi:glucose-1-phosphate adenylyltransferase
MNIDSLVCGGCITSGATVRRSILGPSCKVHSYALVEDSILFENVQIGRHAKIRKAIIDESIYVPEGMEIGFDHEEDRLRGCIVTESGIVVVTK